jgi:hypothetical protein
MDMNTWKWKQEMDAWKWTHGNGHMNMDTRTWAVGHEHMDPRHMETDMKLLSTFSVISYDEKE